MAEGSNPSSNNFKLPRGVKRGTQLREITHDLEPGPVPDAEEDGTKTADDRDSTRDSDQLPEKLPARS